MICCIVECYFLLYPKSFYSFVVTLSIEVVIYSYSISILLSGPACTGRRLKSFLRRKDDNGIAAENGASSASKDVFLRMVKYKPSGIKSSVAGNDVNLLQELAGIVPSTVDNFVCVSKLVPNQPAALSDKIQQGTKFSGCPIFFLPVAPRNYRCKETKETTQREVVGELRGDIGAIQ